MGSGTGICMYMVSILHTNTDMAKTSKEGPHLELHVSSDLDYKRVRTTLESKV